MVEWKGPLCLHSDLEPRERSYFVPNSSEPTETDYPHKLSYRLLVL